MTRVGDRPRRRCRNCDVLEFDRLALGLCRDCARIAWEAFLAGAAAAVAGWLGALLLG